MEEGDTSAIYIGERPEATPMPTPPTKRAQRNAVKLLKAPVPIEEKKKISEETISRRFLPILSARLPHNVAPIMQPNNATVMASPCIVGFSSMPKNTS